MGVKKQECTLYVAEHHIRFVQKNTVVQYIKPYRHNNHQYLTLMEDTAALVSIILAAVAGSTWQVMRLLPSARKWKFFWQYTAGHTVQGATGTRSETI
jgi:hypothetical protein